MGATSRNILANYGATAWAAIAQVAFVPVYIRYLGLEAYGLVGVQSAVLVWLSVADLGITPTLTREAARCSAGERDTAWMGGFLHSVERLAWLLGTVVVVTGLLLSGWLSTHWLQVARLQPGQVELSLDLVMATVTAKWLGNMYRGGIVGLQDQVWLAWLGSAAVTLRSVVVIAVLHFVSRDVRTFFAFGLAVTLLETALMRRRLYARLQPAAPDRRTGAAGLRETLHFSGGMLLISIISVALTQADKILLSRLLPLGEFGAYSFAVTVASVLMTFGAPLFNALYPRLAQQVVLGDVAGQKATYLMGCELIIAFALTSAATLVTFEDAIIGLWTGDPALVAAIAPYFATLVIANMLFAICHIPYALQLAHGWTALSVKLNLAALVLVIPALFYWVPRKGCVAAAAIWLGVNLLFFLVQVGLVNQRAGLVSARAWLLQVFAPPALACLAYFALLHVLIGDRALPAPRIVAVLGIPLLALAGLILTLLATATGRRLASDLQGRLAGSP